MMQKLRLSVLVLPRLGVRAKTTSAISRRLEGKVAAVTASTDGLVVTTRDPHHLELDL